MSETKPTPAAKPDHVRATIDGKAIEVPKGTTVIQAAAQIGRASCRERV